MSRTDSLLRDELLEAPEAVTRQAAGLREPLAALIRRLQHRPPDVVVTCARGSSAHAATYGKHLIERYLGIPVAAAAPNIVSVYRRDLILKNQLVLVVSQSGRSDDLVETARSARRAGAVTAALVNDVQSPLAAECEFTLPLAAGPERSVAATKSFIAALSALLRLTAAWADDARIVAAVDRLPERLSRAAKLEWPEAGSLLARAAGLIVIGRGPTLAIAREAALKLKETCGLQAEAYSGAEFMHGPVTLVGAGYPIVMLMPTDEAAPGMRSLAADLVSKGAALLNTAADGAGRRLPALAAEHPETDAICLIQSFYAMMVELAALRGMSVDRPRHLKKITRTR